MKKLAALLMVVFFAFFISCKKDEVDVIPLVKPDYFQLKTGNYWIYEGFQSDTAGVYMSTGKFDSAYIEKDTMIGGETYFKLIQNPFVISGQSSFYLRDSSGYLVTKEGYLLASDFNFTDTLAVDATIPTLYTGYLKMTGQDSLVSVPAGTFASVTAADQIVPAPPNTANLPVRYTYNVYGKGVGNIKSHTFFYMGNIHLETRLVRYGAR